jgi:HEPN domain-containing protein
MGGGSMADADALALVSIARRDLVAARGMTDATVFHEAVWGFQVQQTIEKALKAWLYLSGVEPPFTHDLVALLKLLEQACCDITPYRDLDRSSWNGRAEALVMSIEAMLPPPALP